MTCRVLKIARQPYYRWLRSPVTGADLVEAYRANALSDAHKDAPEFGYRFLLDEAAEPGRAKRGKNPGPAVHDDLCANARRAKGTFQNVPFALAST